MENNIILICSNEFEGTTDIVCDWLFHLNKKFIRFSHNDKIRIESIKMFENDIDIHFSLKGVFYWLSEIKSFWYRRSKLGFEQIEFVDSLTSLDIAVNDYILPNEFESIKNFFICRLNEKVKLNKEKDNNIIKLEVLFIANSLGLKIPNLIVTRNKSELDIFNNKKIITKAIGDIIFETKDKGYGMMTTEITKKDILEDVFFPTLFQELINKKLDLRIFYFNETFYSTAIFSQNNEKTSVDFRNYDREKPNRVVPFKLPMEIENKLKLLMSKLDLKSGSIDLAYTYDGEYVFFEVNPVGQFEQVSIPGNFNLFKKIALHL